MASARYYDGKLAIAREVGVRAGSHELIVTDADGTAVVARWPAAELEVLGDTEHEKAPPVIRRGEEARLVIEDAELRRQLAQLIPALAPLGRPRARAVPRIALFGATLAAAIGLFWLAIDVGSSTLAPYVPYELQHRLGASVADDLIGEQKQCYGAGLAVINRLANRLAEAADYPHPVEVHVVEGGPVNAFTLPGGILVFYSDLIDKAHSGNEVAGVLAHEMGHVVHYHAIKGLARQYGMEQLLKAMTGGFSDLGTIGQGGSLLLALRNGRSFERDADATGVELLQKLGLRADGIAGFFEQMLKDQPHDAAATVGIWSSHPPTAERIAATRQPATGKPAFSDAEWRSLRAICGGTNSPQRR
ncbi:MAG: M48 family metallopeptidase [Reyranella sp.]|uniref:M48 family metallopeptidase n=1 Tax=Reyranella sp. TaxID=1929291 RepID=UPI001ACAC954|nr:M48 family metallopeptidase [Reyranella sp.]MBN9086410.1 M48 family metallopeptidase [Reyranella sp.]